jgi:hypothetical protein
LVILVLLVSAGLAQQPDFGGPTILSRGIGPVLGGGGELARIRPFFGVHGSYNTDLTPVSVDSEGNIPSYDAYGVTATFGAVGYHTWRRTILGLDYRGSAHHYSRHSYFDGIDQMLSLGVAHQASRRTTVFFRESAGTYTRGNVPLGGIGFSDSLFPDMPTNDLFDARTYHMSSSAGLIFQKSSRLSFGFGGTGMLTRRRSSSLVGVTGALAQADTAYLVNPGNVIGIDYGYGHFEYTNAFGTTDFHAVSFNYGARLGRSWRLGLRAGTYRVESLALRRTAVDPIVAAIIGASQGIERYHSIRYRPRGDVRLSRAFRRFSLSLGYSRYIEVNNGIYLGAENNSVGISTGFPISRRVSLGLSGFYGRYSSLGQGYDTYESYGGGSGLSIRLSSMLHLVTRGYARQWHANGSQLRRTGLGASVGFTFTPGEFPLSFW